MIWTRRASFGGLSNGRVTRGRGLDAVMYSVRKRGKAKTQGINSLRMPGRISSAGWNWWQAVWRTLHLNTNSGHAEMSLRVRKGPKREKAHRKSNWRKPARGHSISEQPVADLSGTVPCKVCGHPVDEKRLRVHMVRFHGGSLK